MTRLLWLTDLHLDFVSPAELDRLTVEMKAQRPDAVLIGGDIAIANSLIDSLIDLADRFAVPIYFVLGNHDYYRGSIAQVREQIRQLSDSDSRLNWLAAGQVAPIGESAVLIGHGGWGDARAGDFLASDVLLNDYLLIDELRQAAGFEDSPMSLMEPGAPDYRPPLMQKLNSLGDESADFFRSVLPSAIATANHIFVLMHVPPFREACWYQGRISDDLWAPHFCCIAAGEVLRDFAAAHPDRTFTVLCGHTHGEGHAEILPNLTVYTGGAEYGHPQVQCVFEVD